MSKGLEALQNIHSHWNCCNPNSNGCDDKDFEIILKELKALEIIKKTPQKVVFVCNSNNYEECLEMMNAFEVVFNFPKEEYDLLKEVLL